MNALIVAVKSLASIHRALKISEDELINLLVEEFQIELSHNAIKRALKSTTLAFTCADRECFIWMGRDGLYRLVDRTECSSSSAAIALLEKRTGYCCKGCGMTEIKSSKPEIIAEMDVNGRKVKDSWVHPACSVLLKRLRDKCYE